MMDIHLVDKLIWEIDNEDDVLEYKLSNGICIWLLIRYHIYTLLLKKVITGFQVASSHPVGKIKTLKVKTDYVKYWFDSYRKTPLSVKESFQCVNICSSLACVPSANGYKSRVSGFLNDLPFLRTLNLIKSQEGVYRKTYAGHHCFYDFIFLKELFKEKLGFYSNRPNATSSKAIATLLKLVLHKLAGYLDGNEMATISGILYDYALKEEGIEKSIKTILVKTAPKLLVIEDANYGSIDTCTLIRTARELNIKTAEIQHGLLDIGFKYTEKLVAHDQFASHKTDYILTYGDYFSNSIKSSSVPVSIGSYHLEIKEVNKKVSSSKPVILLITQREFTDNLIPVMANALKMIRTKFQLIIRLHPSEAANNQKYQALFEFDGTRFSTDDDLYALIQQADYIVGSYSTALYESMYFGKTPFIHRNILSMHFVPEGIGISFSSATELGELLKAPPPQIKSERREYFWKSGCEANFKRFYEREILQDQETPV